MTCLLRNLYAGQEATVRTGHGTKDWFQIGKGSTCAGDLRELLRVPLRSQGYCGVGRGLSGLHWVWCIGIGPHL